VLNIKDQLAKGARDCPELFPDPQGNNYRHIADCAVDGVLLFYNRREVRVGRRDIDWAGGHINHQEWRAQLNRFFQLQALRQTYRQTKDERYALCARDYIEDWINQHEPYDIDNSQCPHGDNSLNMSIRMGGLRFPGWLGVLGDFLPSRAFDETFVEKILASIYWQLDWLTVNLSPDSNWRIAALDAIFSNALRLGDRFSRHQRFAVEGLNIAFEAQILPDGVHLERSGGYHEWMCNVMLNLWRLGKKHPEFGLRFDDNRIVPMHSYSLQHLKPNGEMCAFNDASARYRTNDLSADVLAKRFEDHQSLLAETGQADSAGKLAVFDKAGHVFYRTGWSTDDLWWAFDAIGWCRGGHAHLSRLSIELHNGRRTTVPDPGIFDYEMSNPMAPIGKGTAAHSTMNVNLGNQSNVEGRLVRAVELDGIAVAQGVYEGGYWPGPYRWNFGEGLGRGWFGWHDRTVLWLKDRAMIVLDCLVHDPADTAYLHWVSDDVPIELDTDGMGYTTGDAEGNIRLRVCGISDCATDGHLHRGQSDPPLGWIKSDNEIVPTPLFQVHFSGQAKSGRPIATECATAIVPFTGAETPQFTVTAVNADRTTRRVKITWADGSTYEVIYTKQLGYAVRNCGQVHSDAPMVLIHTPADGQVQVQRVGGTFVRIG